MLKSKAWRDLLLSQMVETIQTDLTPILTQKVKESVKDAVRYVRIELLGSPQAHHHPNLFHVYS